MRFIVPDTGLGDYPESVEKAVEKRQQAVFQAWQNHCEALRPLLTPELKWLLDFSLDDALTRYLHIHPKKRTLSLGLLVGDNQRGYFTADLHYEGIVLSLMEMQLLCLTVADERNDIAWGELERAEASSTVLYTHRIRWHTNIPTHRNYENGKLSSWFTLDSEIALKFTGFSLRVSPCKDRILRRHKEFIRIWRAPNFIEGLC